MKNNKPGACNPMQKGEERKKIHDKQNNVGDPKKKPEYKDFSGNTIE